MKLNENQVNLLENLLVDEKKINNHLYSAGPYWKYKTKEIVYWLKKKGLENFRGSNSGVGTSYTDNVVIDARIELGFKGRLVSYFTKLPYIKKIYNEQLNLTSKYIETIIRKNKILFENNTKVKALLSKYKITNSVNNGCKTFFNNSGNNISMHYLITCEKIDEIDQLVNFSNKKSYLEIGGGFGANIHLILDNFKNIKKVFYIDIVPNLFVGTEYLRSIFGKSVKDYNMFRTSNNISFSNDNELEIICLPPWKMENITSKVDHFHNAASFQEMPLSAVKNYYNLIKKLLNKDSLSLVIYDSLESKNTLSHKTISEIFEKKLLLKELIAIHQKKQIYLISK